MFDLRRFGRLAAATWSESRRGWAWFFAVGIIVHVLLVGVVAAFDRGYRALGFDFQALVWMTGLFLTGTIFAARHFQAMARRESALVMLMRPASSFEKWLLAVLVVAVLYPIVYTLAYQVAGAPSWFYGRLLSSADHAELLAQTKPAMHAELEASFAKTWRYFLPWRAEADWSAVLRMLLAIQGFAVLGSLYFNALPFLKTIVVGFAMVLVLVLASAALGGDTSLFFGYWQGETRLAPWQAIVIPAAWSGVPLLLWLGSLVALREKEVA